MIEVWVAKAWQSKARQKLAAKTLDFFERLPSKRTSIVLAIATPLLVVVWHLVALAQRPSHLDQIASELGCPGMWGFTLINPSPDNAGDRVLFVESGENGYGVYCAQIGGHRKLLYEEPYGGPGAPNARLLGWSPDDKYFAYCRPVNGVWQIAICDGDTGETVANVNARADSGAWLSAQTLAAVNDQHVLYTITQTDGKWSQPQPFKYFKDKSHRLSAFRVDGFSAFDADSVIWQQGNTIWSCGDNDEGPTKVWEATPDTLLEFSYSRPANRLLLHCEGADGPYFADLHPGHDEQPDNITRIDPEKYSPSHLTLINNGKGYAFMSQINLTNTLVTKMDDAHEATQVVCPDQVRGIGANQRQIFVVTSLDNGPWGICEFDAASGAAECVVPNAEEHFDYLTNCAVEQDQVSDASGDTIKYYLYAPPNPSPKKKCPLIMGVLGIGPPGFAWDPTHAALANCGYYFVYVERYKRGYSQWGADVLTVYSDLLKRFNIDTNNVYLYGVSAGAGTVFDLLEEKPELWRGALLFSPGGLFDPLQMPGKHFFIDTGGSDLGRRPRRFQDDAAKAGISVTLVLHPGLGHIIMYPPAERERLREALIFLNEP